MTVLSSLFLVVSLALAEPPTPAPSKSPEPSVAAVGTKDPVEVEFQRLMDLDDSAQAEADQWIKDNMAFSEKGAGQSQSALAQKIKQRFAPVHSGYEAFLKAHPKHVNAHIAFASFLNETGEELLAHDHWAIALKLAPENAVVWNNLGTYYGHNGEPVKSLEYLEKAISLKPKESLYHHNFANTLFSFRRDAMARYHLTEPEVFDKSLASYREALHLDPANFILACDLAQSYYIINPLRYDDARKSWLHALDLARDDIEREGVQLHLARLAIKTEKVQLAKEHLEKVHHKMYDVVKGRLVKNLAKLETPAPPEPAPM